MQHTHLDQFAARTDPANLSNYTSSYIDKFRDEPIIYYIHECHNINEYATE